MLTASIGCIIYLMEELKDLINDIEYAFFDWDGTVLKSNPDLSIKLALKELLNYLYSNPNFISAPLEQTVTRTVGKPRDEHVKDFFNILESSLTKKNTAGESVWDAIYGPIKAGFSEEINSDVLVLFEKLRNSGVKIIVSSVVPEPRLLKTVGEYGITEMVDLILGKNTLGTKGGGHIKRAADFFEVSKEMLVLKSMFVGDTPTDMKLSSGIKYRFLLQPDLTESILKKSDYYIVNSFSSLREFL
ncbi:HAD family hydrolase [bacterium]|nr:HAD family hydrolase [bacterium]